MKFSLHLGYVTSINNIVFSILFIIKPQYLKIDICHNIMTIWGYDTVHKLLGSHLLASLSSKLSSNLFCPLWTLIFQTKNAIFEYCCYFSGGFCCLCYCRPWFHSGSQLWRLHGHLLCGIRSRWKETIPFFWRFYPRCEQSSYNSWWS